jgi:hypothetical protein
MLDQQDGIISEQEAVIAELKSQAAQWQRQNMRLDELCGSYHKELCDYLRETNERESGCLHPGPRAGQPSTILRSRHRRANSMNTVMWELEEGVAERKTPRHGSLI